MSDAMKEAAGMDVNLDRAALKALCHKVLSHHGFSEPHVAAMSDALVAAEMDGCRSHGSIA